MTTKTFFFTTFAQNDLLSGSPYKGLEFIQPATATLAVDVTDNDSRLSGDFFDRARDWSGQTATISQGDDDQGNGGQIYAEREFHLRGDDGKSYTLVEVEQEGSSAKYYTYAGSVPPAGMTLSITGSSNIRSVSYDKLGAGDLPQNIVDIASGSDDFNILVKALSAAGLVDTVKGLDDVTVFAPTDAAFTQLAVDLGFDGDTADEDAVFGSIATALAELAPDNNPIPLLTDILLYHVSGGAKSAAEIDALDAVPTLLAGATFGSEGTELVDNEPDVQNPNIVIPDIAAGNGTIQAIDRVLLPIDIPGNEAPNIVDIASGSDDFNILVKALSAAGLVDTVKGLDDVTVFAPTDAAFTQLAVDLGFDGDTADEDAVFGSIATALAELAPDNNPIPLLTDILLYHVSGGAKSAAEIDALDAVPTLLAGATFGSEGTELVDNEPDVQNPNIVIPDIAAGNGTIQAIDRVLLPIDIPGNEAPNIVDIASGSDDFNILVKALSAAGLVDTVKGLDDVTVFAPTDAAFTQLAVDLGFDGDTADEHEAFGYIVNALTLLSGGGDPIPLLTDVLLYHVSEGAKSAAEIDALDAVPTLLAGSTFGSEGTELVDNEPDIDNPNIVIPDIAAGNGTIQAIDGVLIPADLLQGDGGRGPVDFEIGTDGNERFWTGSNTDYVSGLGGNDWVSLGRGDDVGLGGGGDDKLLGGQGDDVLNGGAGRDVLIGGRDNDTLTGGEDADVFVFNRFSGEDTVTDFTVGEDVIKLNLFGLRNYDQVAHRIEDTADGAVIDLGRAEITLSGVGASDLDRDDFWLT